MMHRLFWLGTIALLLFPLAARSQKPATIVPGSRIRITERGTGKSEVRSGTVVTTGADKVMLKIDPYGETVPYSTAEISRVEVSQGRKGHTVVGLGIGFLAGATIGAVYGVNEAPKGSDSLDITLNSLAWAGIGGGIGMVVGGVAGAIYKTERWEDAPIKNLSISAGAGYDGDASLILSVHF